MALHDGDTDPLAVGRHTQQNQAYVCQTLASPSSIQPLSCAGSFRRHDVKDVVISRGSHLEVRNADTLELNNSQPVHGDIYDLQLFPSYSCAGQAQDLLVMLSSSNNVSVLCFSNTINRFIAVQYIQMPSPVSSQPDLLGHLLTVAPCGSAVAVALADGTIALLPSACVTPQDGFAEAASCAARSLQALGTPSGRHAMTAGDRCEEESDSQSSGWAHRVSRKGNQGSSGGNSSLSSSSGCKVFHSTPTLVHLQQQHPGLGHTIWDLQFLGGPNLDAGIGVEEDHGLGRDASAGGRGRGRQGRSNELSQETKQLSLAVLMHRHLQCTSELRLLRCGLAQHAQPHERPSTSHSPSPHTPSPTPASPQPQSAPSPVPPSSTAPHPPPPPPQLPWRSQTADSTQPRPHLPPHAAQLRPQTQQPHTTQPPSHATQLTSFHPPPHAAQPTPQTSTPATPSPPSPQPPQLPRDHSLSVQAPHCSVACAGVVLLSHKGHLGAPTSLLPVPGTALGLILLGTRSLVPIDLSAMVPIPQQQQQQQQQQQPRSISPMSGIQWNTN
ncbi:hypothetical protein DUNSADRAFT_4007 [Dunaliella salina]|uniref:RSE1/DDB1/CPSF1 first beta-propeller domain-containing protein n=1 Tax=Dunaliella salina TaxID=3046 RepID=A0ABQ7GSU5_DUNSA|nr:hypothetical protein DUNSADRAFT_4007 [Dunaliella salina]|eukprot:KAF5837697.1 hypothetical protein DUNSADRAFT_4007 [Dunaliella salina]